MQRFNMQLSDEEMGRLESALALSGMRTKSELIRFLINEYIKEFYDEPQPN